MRTDLRSHARTAGPPALAVVGAALAVALDAPPWLTTALTVLAALFTTERLVRRRQLGWADAVATGAAGLIVVLMLLGFFLNELPGGLGRVSWAVGSGVLALAAIGWSERRSAPGASPFDVDRRAATRLVPAYAIGAGLAAVALIVSVHATRQATRAPDALSIVRASSAGQVVVEIDTGRAPGRYVLVVTRRDRVLAEDGPFDIAADRHVRRTVEVPARRRSVIELRAAGSSKTLRSLVVSPPAATSGGGR